MAGIRASRRHVRFGSKADIGACPRDVRFARKSGHRDSAVSAMGQFRTHALRQLFGYAWASAAATAETRAARPRRISASTFAAIG